MNFVNQFMGKTIPFDIGTATVIGGVLVGQPSDYLTFKLEDGSTFVTPFVHILAELKRVKVPTKTPKIKGHWVGTESSSTQPQHSPQAEDAEAVLRALGYKKEQATDAVRRALSAGVKEHTETLVGWALNHRN